MADIFDVKSIWQTVERVAQGGEAYTAGEQELTNWLQSHLGLRRAPEAYARRTRQRYQKASREGRTAREVNQREYQERKRKKTGAAKPREAGDTFSAQLNRLIARRNELLPESPVDREFLQEYIDVFGESNVLDLITEQVDSCQRYQRGDSEPGHRRWIERNPTNRINVRPDITTYLWNTDIMYFYHARAGI
jgi:hypothetical protein